MSKCTRCNGTGKICNLDVGISPDGIVPTFGDVPCPKCHGKGETGTDDFDDLHKSSWTRKCRECNGEGMIYDTSTGMGPHGITPSFRKVACPRCGGSGEEAV